MEPGSVLADRFEVHGVLGRGGMATVWMATDRLRGRQVALKILHPHLADQPAMRARLRREVHAAGMVRHEAVLAPSEVHELDGRLALSMPLHRGQNLAEAVAEGGPLEAEELQELARRLAGALAAAHRLGVLHRDVSPHNVMLGGQGAMLTDFGVARVMEGTATAATSALGTAGYSAPEVYRGERSDPRSDLYSLAAVLYYAATGQGPFDAPSPAAMLERQLAGQVEPLAEARPDLPDDLVALIEACLRERPEDRPEAASVIEEVASGEAWRPGLREQALPARSEAIAPPEATALPRGEWTVVARRSGRGASRELAHTVERVAGLPRGSLEPPRRLGKRFRIVQAVQRDTAERIADGCEAAGLSCEVLREEEGGPLREALGMFWLPIPIMWVAFPFLSALGMPPEVLLLIFIPLTILIATVGGSLKGRRAPRDLPLAFPRDLSLALPEPGVVPAPEFEPPSREAQPPPSLAERARAALDGLERVMHRADPPGPAREDLERTLRSLREQVDGLERGLQLAREAQQHRAPEMGDAAPAQARLERLRTLERAGQPADPAELQRLEALLQRIEEAEASRAELEGQVASARAQLLEITAAADRTGQELVRSNLPASTGRLARELREDSERLVDARRELAARGSS